MRKYFYKGESLSILFQTPVPETGERVKITDFQVGATIQGITPSIDVLNDYEMQLFLSSVQTKQMAEGRADIVFTLTQGEKAVIGKNIDLFVSDPLTARPIDGMSDSEDMQLAINTGDVVFDIEFKDLGKSAYQYYLLSTEDVPPKTESEYGLFLASLPTTELERVFNEAERGSNEETRASNEISRVETFGQIVLSAQQAISACETATTEANQATGRAIDVFQHPTRIIEDFWHEWDNTSGEYINTGIRAKGDVNFSTFDIDIETGELVMTHDPTFNNTSFGINNNGELTIIINTG